MDEIYVSTDMEADGPLPGPHSMLSIGSAAFTDSGDLVATFRANLKPLPGSKPDPQTMKWWSGQPEAWIRATENPREPGDGHEGIWRVAESSAREAAFRRLPGELRLLFVYWYLMSFTKESPFGFQALDIKTLAVAALGAPYLATSKGTMPREWFAGLPPHTHDALDDAIEQGMLFFRVREAVRSLLSVSKGRSLQRAAAWIPHGLPDRIGGPPRETGWRPVCDEFPP